MKIEILEEINEDEFYEMCDIIECFKNVTRGWFPTVEQLNVYNVPQNKVKNMPLLIYFSSNPIENISDDNRSEYEKTVAYCKELIGQVNLIP